MAPFQATQALGDAAATAACELDSQAAAEEHRLPAPPADSDGLRPATVEQFGCEQGNEVARAGREAMARGMLQDPCTAYFARKAAAHQLGMWRSMIGLNYKAARQYSEPPLFFCTSCRSAAAMAFVYPQQQVSFFQYMRYGGLAALVRHMPARRWLAAFTHQSAIDRRKHGFLAEHGSALFVWLIAAEPEQQGRGLGSQLMQRINEAADARGLHSYLEATTERSRSLYVRHGYQQIDVLRPEASKPHAPVYYIMTRKPQPPCT